MKFNTLKDVNFADKTVILRVDLNVPYKDGSVTDFTRIDRVKPTIDYLREQGARIVVLAHFGRPKGEFRDDMSLAFLPPFLEKRWGNPVKFGKDCIGEAAQAIVDTLKSGEIALLENLRFHPGEKENDPAFVKQLADLGDIYVNDAFSASHRAHASISGLAQALPAAAGLLMEAELTALGNALESPQRPVAAIVGGAKISTKLELLGNLVEKVDYLALGGGMANTFLHAQGIDIKSSLCEHDMAEQARAIMEKAKDRNCKILLPVDGIIAEKFEENAQNSVCEVNRIPDNTMILDIGPKTVELLKTALKNCKTVVWNGPLGAFEIKPFDNGTTAVARFVAQNTKSGSLVSVAGGGDTVAALENAGVTEDFSYISTAGGAFLEWLEGKTLPGVSALLEQSNAA